MIPGAAYNRDRERKTEEGLELENLCAPPDGRALVFKFGCDIDLSHRIHRILASISPVIYGDAR